MPLQTEAIEAPLASEQLAARWRAMCADPIYEDVPGRVELNEWGESLLTFLGKTRGLAAPRAASCLERGLGGQALMGVGMATGIGVRVPDVCWCSDAWLAAHPEEMPLAGAPEICVEIASPGNALPKLREKALA